MRRRGARSAAKATLQSRVRQALGAHIRGRGGPKPSADSGVSRPKPPISLRSPLVSPGSNSASKLQPLEDHFEESSCPWPCFCGEGLPGAPGTDPARGEPAGLPGGASRWAPGRTPTPLPLWLPAWISPEFRALYPATRRLKTFSRHPLLCTSLSLQTCNFVSQATSYPEG